MKILDRVKNVYKDQGLIVQQKALTLYVINLILFFVFLFFSIIRAIQGDFVVAGAEFFFGFLLGSIALLVKNNKYFLASRISVVFFCFVAWAIYFVQNKSAPNDIYLYCTYMLVIIIMAPFLCYKQSQFIGMIITALAGHIFFNLFYLSLYTANGQEIILGEIIISFVFLGLGCFLSLLIFRMQQANTDIIESQRKKSEEELKSITDLFSSTKSAFDVGEILQKAAKKAAENSDNMATDISSLDDLINTLKDHTERGRVSSEDINYSKDLMEEKINIQTQAIESSYSATKEITSQIDYMTRDAQNKGNVLNQLSESSVMGTKKLGETLESLKILSQSTEEILSVVNVIQGISSRTNLLAMNAAIEAAHAGDAGKGFAVVADEIRKLAEETSRNSKIIKESMKENTQQFKVSNDTAVELQKVINIMTNQIDVVYNSFKEIISGMSTMSTETNRIFKTVDNIQNDNIEVKDSLMVMGESIQQFVSILDGIYSSTAESEESVIHLRTLSAEMVNTSRELKDIGEDNMNNFLMLEKGFESI